MEAAAPQTFRAGAEPGQGHQPVCTFVYNLVSSELTQDHLLWLGSCPPSLRSGVVQALLSNSWVQDMRTLPFPGTAALHNSWDWGQLSL